MRHGRGVLQVIMVMCVCLTVAVPVWADLTLSGSQTRGMGTDGKLRSSGVNLPQGGVVVAVSDAAGAGLWLQGPNGQILRFTPGSKGVGAKLGPGTWYAYPNLPPKANSADCSVTIKTTGAGVDGAYSGTWGEQGQLRLTVKNGSVSGVLSGTDSSGTVISINISGKVDAGGSIQATTQGTIKSGGRSMTAGGGFTGKLASGSGSGIWNFTIPGAGGADPTRWKVQK